MELIEKKKFKKTEIGLIPNDWEFKSIGSEIDLLTGFPFPSNKFSKTGVKLLRGSNVKRGNTDWSEEITQYWETITNDLKIYLLKEGDIVIAMDGSLVGRSFAKITPKDLPALLLQRVARVRSNNIYLDYLKEFICSEYFTKHCDSVKTVSAIPHISPHDIRSFKIPIPPTKEEQKVIATTLIDMSNLIINLEKLIAKKKSIKQGVMQKLLTPKKDWTVKKLSQISKIVRGASPRPIENPIWFDEKSSVGWVRISDVTKSNKYLTETIQKLSVEGIKNSRYVESDNLIMSICATVGRPILTTFDVCIHDGFVLFKNPEIDKNYLYYYLISIEDKWSKSEQTGSQMNLNTALINSTTIPFPKTQEEQIKIANILSDLDEDLNMSENKLEKYRKIKSGMMQNLLTGKIRLI